MMTLSQPGQIGGCRPRLASRLSGTAIATTWPKSIKPWLGPCKAVKPAMAWSPRAQQIRRQDSGDRALQNLILAVEREDGLRNPTLRYTVPSVPLPPLEIKRDALAKSVSQHCSGAVGAHR
jgi:hypothetical protein